MPKDQSDDNEKKLHELKARIEASQVTPELRAQATQLVFGAGNANAEVLFIGEAPGKQEDEQGLPFVGASGKFLNEMLETINMKRADVYITNIVKYRPPGNRDPQPAEKKAFMPYLQEQLEIIQPKIVVTLGRHSGAAFLPELHISRDHGKPKRVRVKGHEERDKRAQGDDVMELVVLPLYHPAAALYNGAMRETLMEDFSLIPAILEKINDKDL
ncbi:uracil-DNA glycosylase [Candidatus Saccharibacteria bacterium]|nr:MAG: uracil-DNA glycosylase [Candidatus Saccharibacteria bacterium]PID98916.1 MAG: uracil-DNA glycosylase [Candidatus Saccharibacteria bacterium]